MAVVDGKEYSTTFRTLFNNLTHSKEEDNTTPEMAIQLPETNACQKNHLKKKKKKKEKSSIPFCLKTGSIHNEVPLHASQDGCYPKVYKQ